MIWLYFVSVLLSELRFYLSCHFDGYNDLASLLDFLCGYLVELLCLYGEVLKVMLMVNVVPS